MSTLIDPNNAAPLELADAKRLREGIAMAWRWTVPAIKAALEHAGVPPKLNMQAMLSAAFAVDGPELTANVFEIAVGTRVRELDADPILLPIPDGVTTVQLNGQFLLMLLANRLDLLTPERKALPGAPAEHTEQLGLDVTT